MSVSERARWTHEPVLLAPTVERLVADRDGLYLDATLGLGGHAEALLRTLSARGKVLGLDADPEALADAVHRLAAYGGRFHAVRANFRSLGSVLERENFFPLSGALFDLGVSSLQLDKPARGFSFLREGPLDMRMGPDCPLTAAEIVNRWPPGQIAALLCEFGEEPEAERVARAIAARRGVKPIATTTELAAIVASVLPRAGRHPATRTFQALRVAVNQELDALTRALEILPAYLAAGARLCVITFHSLEDRIVKNAFASLVAQDKCAYLGRDGRCATAASDEEVARNPRARSAKLRVVEKK